MFDAIENVHPDERRGWTTLVSFTMQAAAVAVVLTVPLLYPGSLSDPFNHKRIFVPITEPGVTVTTEHPTSAGGGHAGPMLPSTPPLVVNQNPGIHFPAPTNPSNVADPTPSFDPTAGRHGTGSLGLDDIAASASSVHPILEKPPIISRPMQGYLIHRVEPIYPTIAKMTGVQGAVLIKAVISTNGRIEQAQVVSGSPFLSKAALDAIQQWRYRPYLLNDKPVEVETEITVTFYLTR